MFTESTPSSTLAYFAKSTLACGCGACSPVGRRREMLVGSRRPWASACSRGTAIPTPRRPSFRWWNRWPGS
eukprot:5452526-Lingulodinium_polyedra.AAC.1